MRVTFVSPYIQNIVSGSSPILLNLWGTFAGIKDVSIDLSSVFTPPHSTSPLPDIIKSIPIEKFTHTKNNFIYETFVNIVEDEFIPELNYEHVGYAWVDVDHFPKPLHPGLYQTLNIDSINEKIKTLISQWGDD